MSTRLYLSNKTPPNFTPSLIDFWNDKTQYDTKGIAKEKYQIPFATKGVVETSASYFHVLARQFITPPLAAGIVFTDDNTGWVKAQIRAMESDLGANMKLMVRVAIYLEDGSWENTIVSSYSATEFAATLTNRSFYETQGLTDYVTIGGERLSIQIGFRCENTDPTSFTGTFDFGGLSDTDLPEDETTTTRYCPWIEFSQDLVFLSESDATRLYLANVVPPIGFTPSFISDWQNQASYVLKGVSATKESSAFATQGVEESVGYDAVLVRMFVTPPLAAGISWSRYDTFRGQIRAMESDLAANHNLRVHIELFSESGEWIHSITEEIMWTEFGTVLTNRSFFGTMFSSYTTVGGERLTIEIGYWPTNAGGTFTGSFEFGDNSPNDLPIDESSVSQFCPWIEFDKVITFQTPAPAPVKKNVKDDFNRANVDPIGGNWTTMPDHGAHKIYDQKSRTSAEGWAASYWNADEFHPDQFAQVTVQATLTDVGPGVRLNNNKTGYAVLVDTGGDLKIYQNTGTGWTQIGSTIIAGVQVGDKVKIISRGIPGEVEVFVNGVYRGKAPGHAAVNSGAPGQVGKSKDKDVDDWKGGDLFGSQQMGLDMHFK